MKLQGIISNTGEWLRGEGPHHQVVVSSRVRLARNLRNRAFPGWAKKAERMAILELIKPRAEESFGLLARLGLNWLTISTKGNKVGPITKRIQRK